MMLTEKECKEALSEIEDSLCELEQIKTGVVVNCLFDKNLETINQLIEEHYSNPPLKFEELQERETYYHIYYGWISIRSISDCECILINTLNSDGYKQIEFEEDCFYRKEVQE